MTKKKENVKFFIDEMKKAYADGEMEVRVPWDDDKEPVLVFNAKMRLPYDDKIEIIEQVADKCFDEDGNYYPEVKQMAYWLEYVKKGTDIADKYKLDDQAIYELISQYGDIIMEALYRANLDNDEAWTNPVEDLEAILDERIDYMKKLYLREKEFRPVEKFNTILDKIDGFIKSLEAQSENLDLSKIETILYQMKDMPEAFTKAAIEYEKEQAVDNNVIELKRMPAKE